MLRRDLVVPSVKQEVRNHTINYRHRLDHHPNRLANPISTDLPPLEGSSGTIWQIFQLDSSKRTVIYPVDKTDRF